LGGCSWSLTYEDIISVENLLDAWREFVKGKRKRKDVQEFERYLMQNILELHRELSLGTYQKVFRLNKPAGFDENYCQILVRRARLRARR